MRLLRRWLKKATVQERQRLVALAGTSKTYLYMLSEGLRIASPEMAAKIVDSANRINKKLLPKLTVGDLSPVCANCRFYKKCKK